MMMSIVRIKLVYGIVDVVVVVVVVRYSQENSCILALVLGYTKSYTHAHTQRENSAIIVVVMISV
jgi:hypothetical protein